MILSRNGVQVRVRPMRSMHVESSRFCAIFYLTLMYYIECASICMTIDSMGRDMHDPFRVFQVF